MPCALIPSGEGCAGGSKPGAAGGPRGSGGTFPERVSGGVPAPDVRGSLGRFPRRQPRAAHKCRAPKVYRVCALLALHALIWECYFLRATGHGNNDIKAVPITSGSAKTGVDVLTRACLQRHAVHDEATLTFKSRFAWPFLIACRTTKLSRRTEIR